MSVNAARGRLSVVLGALLGCTGSTGQGPAEEVTVTQLPASDTAHCPAGNGGVSIQVGSRDPQYVCNGANGAPAPTALGPATFVESRAAAALRDLTGVEVVITGGYAKPGDGGGATFKKVAAGRFVDTAIATATITSEGSGYLDGAYTDIYLGGTTGIGAFADLTVSGGHVTSVTPVRKGQNFAVGDVLGVDPVFLGGTGSGFVWTVQTVTAPLGSFVDAAGNAFQLVVDQGGFTNIRQFGAKQDWAGDDATATNDFVSIQAALDFAGFYGCSASARRSLREAIEQPGLQPEARSLAGRARSISGSSA